MFVNPLYNREIYSPWKLAVLHRIMPRCRPHKAFEPKRILLCNTGRLGDTFITTQMLPRLETVEVGFLVAKEGQPAVEGCPGICQVHVIEPWYRSSDSKREKWNKWRRFRRIARDRQEEFSDYDTVIFCNPHYGGLTPLFPNAYTIGFDSHADRFQFSQVIPWNPHLYLAEVYQRVLDTLEFEKGPAISPWSERARQTFFEGEYCVMHIGASDSTKDYSVAMWQRVYEGLKERGERVVFTGKGQRALITAVTSSPEENFCDQLSWLEFLRVIFHSKLVISVDTVALHVAAAFQRPLIALYRDAPDQATWSPTCRL